MSNQTHEHWEELAAGHALDALEPAETAEFTTHLQGCVRCQDVLADHAFVAAQLGSLVDVTEVPAPSWTSIRSGVVTTPAPVPSLAAARERRRTARVLAVAASAVLVLGAGALAWQVSRPSPTSSVQQALSACTTAHGCLQVQLQSQGTGRAVVLLRNGTAQVVRTALGTADQTHVYVLWQLPRDGSPVFVSALPDVATEAVGVPHTLVLPVAQTAAFGVSLERRDVVPVHPSLVVAVGSA